MHPSFPRGKGGAWNGWILRFGRHAALRAPGFRRIRLAPGEQRQVSFTLGDEALALIDPQGRRVVEKGDFVIAVGSSSQDIRLQTTVTLE